MKERIAILVCDRGNIFVGHIKKSEDFPFAFDVRNARVIRRWGTSEGLSQLQNGPLPETVLDAMCNKIVFYRWVGEIIEVDQKAWQPHLA